MLSIGDEESEYHAIGRGMLNIGNLPVLCDSAGFFGNPASDLERTFVTEETRIFLKECFRIQGI